MKFAATGTGSAPFGQDTLADHLAAETAAPRGQRGEWLECVELARGQCTNDPRCVRPTWSSSQLNARAPLPALLPIPKPSLSASQHDMRVVRLSLLTLSIDTAHLRPFSDCAEYSPTYRFASSNKNTGVRMHARLRSSNFEHAHALRIH